MDGLTYGYITDLIFMRIVDKKSRVGDYDYASELIWSMITGPIWTIIAILLGIIWLLAVIPHRLLFGKEKK